MVNVGTMNTVKKQNKVKSKASLDTSKNTELVFVDKEVEPCNECKQKPEVKVELPNWTFDELERILPLLDKYGIERQEQEYIYNLFNRIFKVNERPGCGKCLINVIKKLKAKYQHELNKQ
jgi:hypothetical protein